jgi:Exonuclease V gamma subunit
MRTHHLPTAEALVQRLDQLWSGPRPDPFAFDLAIVPGAGFQRWLSQQLSLVGDGAGVCAGIEFSGWPAFERRIFADDPWRPERLAWTIQAVLDGPASDDPALAVLRRHLDAASEHHSACRRVAFILAGYLRHRPSLVAGWLSGSDTDETGEPLREDAWQAHLCRLLGAHIGVDPLRWRADVLSELAARPTPGLPHRIAVLAPADLDPAAIELLEALGTQHQVDVLALSPSVAASPAASDTLLARLQDSIAGRPQAALPLAADDDSIQVHLSHGPDRQVEVLREVLAGVLAADPGLEPRNVAVLTPTPDLFAPLIGATFAVPDHPAHRFRVQLADRSISQVNPLAGLLLELLRLPDTRAEASAVLELALQPAVARKFGFGVERRERLVELVTSAGIRWGLSARHRERFGLVGFEQNTWFAGLQRMLLGVALDESGLVTAKTVLPLDDVESTDVELIGALTELIGRILRLVDTFGQPATVADWVDRCHAAITSLADPPATDDWQLADLWSGLARIAATAGSATIGRADFCTVVDHEFTNTRARATFGNGSLIVAGLESLRHVPHQVLVLLGWDGDHYPRNALHDGDDLLRRHPSASDPDPTAFDRQLLLDAVQAARRQLVVICRDRSEATNEQVPLAAPIVELLAVIDSIAAGPAESRATEAITVQHPLQPHDPAYFGTDPSRERLVSADPHAYRAALAAQEKPSSHLRGRYQLDPLPPLALDQGVTVDELTGFFAHPVRTLLRVRAGVSLGERPTAGDELPIEPDHLARWQVGNRVLQRLREGYPVAAIEQAEWLRGEVPPFALGSRELHAVLDQASATMAVLPRDLGEPSLHEVSLAIPVGDRTIQLAGRVVSHGRELLAVEYSSLQARHRLVTWLRLLCLAAAEPGPWRARVIGKGRRAAYQAPDQQQARDLLGRYLELYRLGLSRPLPALPRLGAQWAGYLASGRNPHEVPASAFRTNWQYDADPSWLAFFDFGSVFGIDADVVVPGADPAESSLVGALADAIWTPILAAEVAP